MELQEDEEMDKVLMDSRNEVYLVYFSCHDLSDSHQPPKSLASLSEEHVVYSTLDMTSEYKPLTGRMGFPVVSHEDSLFFKLTPVCG